MRKVANETLKSGEVDLHADLLDGVRLFVIGLPQSLAELLCVLLVQLGNVV